MNKKHMLLMMAGCLVMVIGFAAFGVFNDRFGGGSPWAFLLILLCPLMHLLMMPLMHGGEHDHGDSAHADHANRAKETNCHSEPAESQAVRQQ